MFQIKGLLKARRQGRPGWDRESVSSVVRVSKKYTLQVNLGPVLGLLAWGFAALLRSVKIIRIF